MTSLTEYLWFNTKKQRDLLNITEQVDEVVSRSGVRESFRLVSAMHITASIWVNDHEPGLWEDFWELIERLASERPDYKHHNAGKDNGDAHLKRTLVGHQALLPVTNGKLDLGPWEQVFYVEFDGRRRKRVVVKVLGE
jgi:secondary thiamine-phosphate synthase enzyme